MFIRESQSKKCCHLIEGGRKKERGREGREVVEEWIDAGTGGGGVWLGEDGE